MEQVRSPTPPQHEMLNQPASRRPSNLMSKQGSLITLLAQDGIAWQGDDLREQDQEYTVENRVGAARHRTSFIHQLSPYMNVSSTLQENTSRPSCPAPGSSARSPCLTASPRHAKTFFFGDAPSFSSQNVRQAGSSNSNSNTADEMVSTNSGNFSRGRRASVNPIVDSSVTAEASLDARVCVRPAAATAHKDSNTANAPEEEDDDASCDDGEGNDDNKDGDEDGDAPPCVVEFPSATAFRKPSRIFDQASEHGDCDSLGDDDASSSGRLSRSGNQSPTQKLAVRSSKGNKAQSPLVNEQTLGRPSSNASSRAESIGSQGQGSEHGSCSVEDTAALLHRGYDTEDGNDDDLQNDGCGRTKPALKIDTSCTQLLVLDGPSTGSANDTAVSLLDSNFTFNKVGVVSPLSPLSADGRYEALMHMSEGVSTPNDFGAQGFWEEPKPARKRRASQQTPFETIEEDETEASHPYRPAAMSAVSATLDEGEGNDDGDGDNYTRTHKKASVSSSTYSASSSAYPESDVHGRGMERADSQSLEHVSQQLSGMFMGRSSQSAESTARGTDAPTSADEGNKARHHQHQQQQQSVDAEGLLRTKKAKTSYRVVHRAAEAHTNQARPGDADHHQAHILTAGEQQYVLVPVRHLHDQQHQQLSSSSRGIWSRPNTGNSNASVHSYDAASVVAHSSPQLVADLGYLQGHVRSLEGEVVRQAQRSEALTRQLHTTQMVSITAFSVVATAAATAFLLSSRR